MIPGRMTRRAFVGAGMTLPIGLGAVEAFRRLGPPRLRLSLAAYSFGADFAPGKDGAAPRTDMFRFIDYCAEHGCEGAELTSYYFPDPVTDEFLAKVRRHAHVSGITVSGTAVGNTFTHPPGPEREKEIAGVKRWIERAAILGAPHIRVFAGNTQKGQTRAEAVKNCVSALDECAGHAGKYGIFLGIENHGGIVSTPDELLEVVRASNSPWVGVNLDTGNFHGEDPYQDLARCAPYAVNVQYKGEIRRKGASQSELADLPRVVQMLRDARYQGWVALEYEMKEDAWTGVPPLLARLKAALAS